MLDPPISDIDRVRDAVKVELPEFNRVGQQARKLSRQIEIGRSAFLDYYGVESELDYKQQSVRDGHIMYHAHIGMNDIGATADAVADIHRQLAARDLRLDRAGYALDRRMGLPVDRRAAVAAETGPMLTSATDWNLLAQAAPVQPHLGDFMIGQPASVANTAAALRIGCTTIGNLSQYFTFEAPGWDDAVGTASASVEAIALLARFRSQGAMLHSYLEDGYGALFRDCASVAAWAMLERYIVEELIGARLSHCIGGLTRDPVKRVGWVIALNRIHGGDHVGSMIYGDTLSFSHEFEKNRAVTAEYLQWDILAQLHTPSGHAVLPLPVTEAIRIPAADEILEAQLFGRQVEASARRLFPHVDFSAAQHFSDTVCQQGVGIFRSALAGLADLGVATDNPLQMLYVLKKLGAQGFERLFVSDPGAGKATVTDMFSMTQDVIDEYRPMFAEPAFRDRVSGKRFLVASTDVHEHAAGALAQLLGETEAEVTYLGAEQGPAELVASLRQGNADVLLLSTHNGMALEYAQQLRQLLDAESLSLPVIMGGVLNQKTDAHVLPVPVLDELRSLGMLPVTSLPGFTRLLPEGSWKS